MNAVVPMRSRDLTAAQLDIIKRTVAKDCNRDEFDHFIAVAQRLGLDPLRKQICALVFSKSDQDKRNMAIVTQIDGFRVLAARCGDYRPMETPAIIEYDDAAKNADTNPLGIVRAEVRAWKRFGDEWHPVAAEAYWDEFAPLEDEWAFCEIERKRKPTGKKKLSDKSPWRRMARVMIAKCAEAQALRRGWPDDLSGVYAEEELHRAQVIDVASEVVSEYEEQSRLKRIGVGKETLLLQFGDGPLESVIRGAVADRLFSWVREAQTAQDIITFQDRNAAALRTFWAWDPGDALEVKRFIEQRIEALALDQKQARGGDSSGPGGSMD